MALSKRHFEAIAAIIKETTGRDCQGATYDTVCIARKMADYFATENPRFDRSKFLAACGI